MRRVAFYALIISTTILVGICMGASNSMATSGNTTTEKNIVNTIAAKGNLKTLATALEASGLVDSLKAKGPYTVFAPTDAAFARIPKADLEALLANKTQLTAVLKYHVVPGKITSANLKNGMMLKTLLGKNLSIKLAKGSVLINNATVVQANMDSTNGVIHAIDTVLMPK